MDKWWHRAKLAFFVIPLVLLVLFLDLLAALGEGLAEFWNDWRDLRAAIRDEWTVGAEEAQARRTDSPTRTS